MKKIFVFSIILCALVIANISLADSLTNGLVAYYPLDGNANDMSGNNNFGVTNNVSFVDGLFGKAAKFGGFDDPGSIRVSNSPSLQFGSEFSIDLWARVDQMGSMDGSGRYDPTLGGGCIFAKDHDRYGFHSKVFVLPNYDFTAYFANNYFSSPKTDVGGTINPYTLGKWVNIGFTINATESKLYMNGSLINAASNSAVDFSIANSRDLYFGQFSEFWYPFKGALDEVRIYNRALSSGEIQQLSAAPTPVPPPPKTYGLFVGIQDKNLRADLAAQIVSDAFKAIIPRENIIVLSGNYNNGGVPNDIINTTIDGFKLRAGDTLLLYLSSHGEQESFTNNNTTSIKINPNFLSETTLKSYLANKDDINKWVILDACYSGGFQDSLMELNNLALLTSAPADKEAPAWKFQGDDFFYGMFSTALSQAFDETNEGYFSADRDEDGKVTLDELYIFTANNPYILAKQGEVCYWLNSGDSFIFNLDQWNPEMFNTGDFSGYLSKSAIPIPGSLWLFGSGLLSLVGVRRFRKG